MAVSITAVEQNSYPPRVQLTVTGLTLADRVEVYRAKMNTSRTLVRAGLNESVADTTFIVIDAELAYGEPYIYVAVVNGVDADNSGGYVQYNLDDDAFDVITDAITGAAAQAIRTAQPEWQYDNNVTVYPVGTRNIAVSNGTGQYSSEIEFYTASDSSSFNFKDILRTATSGVLQLRDSIGGSDYIVVTSFREVRYSNDRTDGRRFFVLEVVQTDAWADSLEARGFTLQDIADYYGLTGTLQDIADDYTDLLSIAQGDFS